MSITGSNNPFACNPVVFANANSIVSLGTITRDGNEFTFSVGFVWKINGVTYQNTAPVVLTIAEASEGFQRIDNALLNTSNTIELQQGLESDTIALQPVAGPTTIVLTSFDVNGDVVNTPPPPTTGSQFKQKNESRKFSAVLSGTNQVVEFRTAGHQHYAVSGSVTSVAGFGKTLLLASTSAEIPYAGKDIFFENNSGHDITLKDNFSGVDIKFSFGADLVVPANGIVWLKYDATAETLALFFKNWSEVDLSTKADLVGGKVPSSQLPAYVDDILEFANLAAFPGTGETEKIYVALDTNFTYRWSGSAYVKISDSGKLDKSTTASSVYGTDSSGGQTMIPVSELRNTDSFMLYFRTGSKTWVLNTWYQQFSQNGFNISGTATYGTGSVPTSDIQLNGSFLMIPIGYIIEEVTFSVQYIGSSLASTYANEIYITRGEPVGGYESVSQSQSNVEILCQQSVNFTPSSQANTKFFKKLTIASHSAKDLSVLQVSMREKNINNAVYDSYLYIKFKKA